jgi:hypothetical protein
MVCIKILAASVRLIKHRFPLHINIQRGRLYQILSMATNMVKDLWCDSTTSSGGLSFDSEVLQVKLAYLGCFCLCTQYVQFIHIMLPFANQSDYHLLRYGTRLSLGILNLRPASMRYQQFRFQNH